tara:strand:- start:2773 stop:3087 length:315 start_codon:yes stop_codon:yes gene_type:complete
MSDNQTMPFYKTSSFLCYSAISGLVLVVSLIFSDFKGLDVLWILLLYIYFNRWIYGFIFRQRMYIPAGELKLGEHDIYRFIVFVLGVAFTLSILFIINGVLQHA